MLNNGEKQVELFFASVHNLKNGPNGYEPLWIPVPLPHTRCSNENAAKTTIEQLKRHDPNYHGKIFKIVRVTDGIELFNEFKAN